MDSEYFVRDILCYYKNRLVFTMKSVDDRYCGFV